MECVIDFMRNKKKIQEVKNEGKMEEMEDIKNSNISSEELEILHWEVLRKIYVFMSSDAFRDCQRNEYVLTKLFYLIEEVLPQHCTQQSRSSELIQKLLIDLVKGLLFASRCELESFFVKFTI